MITTAEQKNFLMKEMQHIIDSLSIIYMETLEPQDPALENARCSIIKLSDRIHGTKNHIDSVLQVENEIL